MMTKKSNKKIRINTYDIDSVLNSFLIQNKNYKTQIDNCLVKIRWMRLKTFQKSRFCTLCKLKGEFFALEKNVTESQDIYHFALYGIKNNEEILFNIDHIKPKCKNGLDEIDNYQTTCYNCNIKKGSKYNN